MIQRSLFYFYVGGGGVDWLRSTHRAEGRAAADTSSCLEAWSGQSLRTAWQVAEEISTFHQKGGGSWMACVKSYYWIFSDFHKLVAMVQADCNAFTIYISFPTLYLQQKVRFWKEDNIFSGFICMPNTAYGVTICGSDRESHPGSTL